MPNKGEMIIVSSDFNKNVLFFKLEMVILLSIKLSISTFCNVISYYLKCLIRKANMHDMLPVQLYVAL